MNNILTAIFKDNKYCHVSGLWQYDYGQVLRIQGLNLPKAVEIHFSLTESSGDSITRIGTTKDGATDVIIPDSMLENGDTGQNYNIYAFIFLSEINSGKTEYRIKISVKARPKPEIPGTPEEPELFRETINAVNDAADRAETAERNAKVSEEAAAEHAKKTEGSVIELDTARKKALKEINDKKAEGVNALVKQKETSEQSVTKHTDREIQRVTQKANEINNSLNKSITEASNKKSALDESANTSAETKKQLDLSIESGKKTKADLDQSIEDSANAKSNLDGSVEEANTIKTELAEAVETASTLDGSLGIKIEEGKQVEKNIVASGEKAVEDINTTGAEKLKVMQDIAEEFAADREQIDTNKNNISSIKEEIVNLPTSKDLAKTDRKLDVLWKLNKGISYKFEEDNTAAYEKKVPTGAKLASVKGIGGKTIVWNQIFKNTDTESGLTRFVMQEDGTICISGTTQNTWINFSNINDLQNRAHKYYIKFTIIENPNNISMYYGYLNRKSTTETIVKGSSSFIFSQSQEETNEGRGQGLAGFVGDKKPVFDGVKVKIICIDLTLMFGKGNEPVTAAEFEAMFPEDYYPYNEGEIVIATVTEVTKKGKNILEHRGFSAQGKPGDDNALTNSYGTTISTVEPNDSIIVIQTIAEQTDNIQGYQNGYFNIGVGNLEMGKEYIFSYDVKPTKMLLENPKTLMLINGKIARPPVGDKDLKMELNKTTRIAYAFAGISEKIQYLEIRVSGVSGIYSNFQIEEGGVASEYSAAHEVLYPIPQAIQNIEGYGWSVGAVYNYVDFEEEKFIKRVGRVDLGSLKWAFYNETGLRKAFVAVLEDARVYPNTECPKFMTAKFPIVAQNDEWVPYVVGADTNKASVVVTLKVNTTLKEAIAAVKGEILYYELASPVVIDIPEEVFQEPIEVECNGSWIFKNKSEDGFKIPVPNTIEYAVKLSEVAQ